jgi:hypothetical protein
MDVRVVKRWRHSHNIARTTSPSPGGWLQQMAQNLANEQYLTFSAWERDWWATFASLERQCGLRCKSERQSRRATFPVQLDGQERIQSQSSPQRHFRTSSTTSKYASLPISTFANPSPRTSSRFSSGFFVIIVLAICVA